MKKWAVVVYYRDTRGGKQAVIRSEVVKVEAGMETRARSLAVEKAEKAKKFREVVHTETPRCIAEYPDKPQPDQIDLIIARELERGRLAAISGDGDEDELPLISEDELRQHRKKPDKKRTKGAGKGYRSSTSSLPHKGGRGDSSRPSPPTSSTDSEEDDS